eukprot:gene8617-9547_t
MATTATNLILVILSCSLYYVSALTADEIRSFRNGAVVDSTLNATYYRITSTGLPDHSTQKVNPNNATHQNHQIWVKKSPVFASKTYCLPLGKIGIAINGVSLSIHTRLKATMLCCNGHPAPMGEYHYHQLPSCIYNGTADEFIGVALDGYPIYGPNVSDLAREITTADLDECHGRTSAINGVTAYRYYISRQLPYILGCFKGEIQPAMGFNASYVCAANATACQCPTMQRRRPPGAAGCNTASILVVSVLMLLSGYFMF